MSKRKKKSEWKPKHIIWLFVLGHTFVFGIPMFGLIGCFGLTMTLGWHPVMGILYHAFAMFLFVLFAEGGPFYEHFD